MPRGLQAPDPAGRRAAQGSPGRPSPGSSGTFVPRGTRARRHLGAGLARRHRRGAADRPGARPRRQPAQPVLRPALVDARPDRRVSNGCASPSTAPRSTCAGGRVDVGVNQLVGVRPGRGVGVDRAVRPARGPGGDARRTTVRSRISGPFGTLRLGLRSIAVDLPAQHVAGVTADGTRVLESDKDRATGQAGHPRRRTHRLRRVAPTCCGRPTTSTASCGWSTGRPPAPGCPWCAPATARTVAARRGSPGSRWSRVRAQPRRHPAGRAGPARRTRPAGRLARPAGRQGPGPRACCPPRRCR